MPPPPKKNADVRIRANFGQNSGKLGQTLGKFGQKWEHCFFFFFLGGGGGGGGGSSIIFAGIACRISRTPKPILKYRTVLGAVKKGARVPPPPPPCLYRCF